MKCCGMKLHHRLTDRPVVFLLLVTLCWLIFSENIRQTEAGKLLAIKKLKKILPLLALMPKKKTILLPLPIPLPLPLPVLKFTKQKEMPDLKSLLAKFMAASGGGWGSSGGGGWSGGSGMMMPMMSSHEMEGQSGGYSSGGQSSGGYSSGGSMGGWA
ncbi:uncharacterized protein LOC107363751 [Tetranychus urticae]|nr:uncharacterized protein LOC107363751 [Tetranychus urticae]